MMSLQMTPPTSLVFLLLVYGAAAQNWAVIYSQNTLCALKRSTVKMFCSYTFPQGHKVTRAFWTKQWPVNGGEPPDLSDDPEYKGRVQYLGDKLQNCTLRLKHLTENDRSKYYFRFITDQPGGRWQGAGGVDLSVTDLQVEVPERVMEGEEITLTCKTSCSLTDSPTFTWYRNGRPFFSSCSRLILQSVSREDTDRYHCAVLAQKLHSPDVTLNVRYGPKDVSVSIRPSGETVEGGSVTLTCSSDGNPPVKSYTWFKEGESSPVGSGPNYRFILNSSNVGWYFCEAWNEHGSQKSAPVHLPVKDSQTKVLLFVILGVAAWCGGLFLIVIFIRRKRGRSLAEAPREENVYSNVVKKASTADPTPDLTNQVDALYATVEAPRPNYPRNEESASVSSTGVDEELQYGNIQPRHHEEEKMSPEDGVQYTTVKFSLKAQTRASAKLEDPTVIYSSVN